jgi:hypothetical protein
VTDVPTSADDLRDEVRSMVVDLHAAQFDGATSLPDRPLDTVRKWLLDLVRKDRARLSGGNATFSVPAMSLPPMTAGCAGCDGFRPIGHVPPCSPSAVATPADTQADTGSAGGSQ